MNNNKNNTIYIGNIVQDINGEKILIKENIYLIYSESSKTYRRLEILNYIIDLDLNKNLDPREREEYQNLISENTYTSDKGKVPYVDEESLKLAFPSQKNKGK